MKSSLRSVSFQILKRLDSIQSTKNNTDSLSLNISIETGLYRSAAAPLDPVTPPPRLRAVAMVISWAPRRLSST